MGDDGTTDGGTGGGGDGDGSATDGKGGGDGGADDRRTDGSDGRDGGRDGSQIHEALDIDCADVTAARDEQRRRRQPADAKLVEVSRDGVKLPDPCQKQQEQPGKSGRLSRE